MARAETDLPRAPEKAAAPIRRPWIVAAVAGVLLPAIAVGLYLRVGEPRSLDPAAIQAAQAAQAAPHENASEDFGGKAERAIADSERALRS